MRDEWKMHIGKGRQTNTFNYNYWSSLINRYKIKIWNKKMEIKKYIYVHDNAMPYDALSSFLLWINTQKNFEDACIYNHGEIKTIKI